MYSLSETQKLLEQLKHSPQKKLGQNFLIEKNIVQKSLQLANIQENDCVVEIGPGLGTLTSALLENGAKVWAIEKDPTLFAFLENTFQHNPNLNLIHGDALDEPIAKFSGKKFKIVANLPYAITTPWMDAILSGPLPEKMVLMLQKENADRFISNNGTKNFGAISIFLKSAYTPQKGHFVSENCFFPKPKVGSCLLHLEKNENPVLFSEENKQIIRNIFIYRRKQISSILKLIKNENLLPEFQKHLSLQTRPENIPLEIWQAIFI